MPFVTHDLGAGMTLLVGRVPEALNLTDREFDTIWKLHPDKRHLVHIGGRWTEVPRWQQAYGASYAYTGSENIACPVPTLLTPFLMWARQKVDERLNGLLLNWYEGPNDYIGPHRDSIKHMIPGVSIVTISFGETRTFRLTRGKSPEKQTVDFPTSHGTVFVMPFKTNRVWRHSVPKRTRYVGRRISITLRAFENGVLSPDEYFEDASQVVDLAQSNAVTSRLQGDG